MTRMSTIPVYVYEGVEVILTGRHATKNLNSRRMSTRNNPDVLHEIKPKSADNGTWTKWVRMVELYEIINPDGKQT